MQTSISVEEYARRLKTFSDARTPLLVFLVSGDRSITAKLSGFVRAFSPERMSFSDDAMQSPDVRPSAYIEVSRSAIVSCLYGEPKDVFPDSELAQIAMEERYGVSMLIFELNSGGRLVVYERRDLSIGP